MITDYSEYLSKGRIIGDRWQIIVDYFQLFESYEYNWGHITIVIISDYSNYLLIIEICDYYDYSDCMYYYDCCDYTHFHRFLQT